ncbi:unnamed protein product [Boreogadus saida]
MVDRVALGRSNHFKLQQTPAFKASLRLCGPADEQLRRGELGASPAAKLREYNPFLWRRAHPAGAAAEGKSGGGDTWSKKGLHSRAELPDCRRATPAGAARPPELLDRWSCHLDSAPVQLPEHTARAAGLRPDVFNGGRQLRRGELGGSPAAQSRFMDFRESMPKFLPPILLNHGRDIPHYESLLVEVPEKSDTVFIIQNIIRGAHSFWPWY